MRITSPQQGFLNFIIIIVPSLSDIIISPFGIKYNRQNNQNFKNAFVYIAQNHQGENLGGAVDRTPLFSFSYQVKFVIITAN